MSEIKCRLTTLALEAAALLNLVEDDDERDLLHGHLEKVVNDELYAGSINRRQTMVLLADIDRVAAAVGLAPAPLCEVVDLHSVRVERNTTAAAGSTMPGERRLPQEVKE